MKTRHLLASLALACAAGLPLMGAAQSGLTVQGVVLETHNAAGYTYLRLKTRDGETWAAVTSAEVKKGAQVTIGNASTMVNFESKTLKRRFDKILFGQLVAPGAASGAPGATPAAATGGLPGVMHGAAGGGMPHAMMAAPLGAPAAAQPALPSTPVPKAKGPEARTVAEVVQGKASLKGKTVLVRGRVVKVNKGIMGKNWLHLQDGSGKAQDGSNDLLVTSQDLAAVGDIVTARGIVSTDVTLGAGYAYAVLVEEAAVKKQAPAP